MASEVEENILLQFKEKIDQSFFTEKNIFFKMVNLDTDMPHVQIGHHIFNGKYEDSIGYGTNLFFEEQDFPRPPCIYEQQTPIHLKYIAKTSKILSLRWQKVPDEIIDVDTKDLIELEFIENYETVLNKIETGTLDIKDVIKRQKLSTPSTATKKNKAHKKIITEVDHIENEIPIIRRSTSIDQPIEDEEIDVIMNPENEENRYDLLKQMVMKSDREPEYYYSQGSLEHFSNESELLILKELYLKNLDYKSISLEVDGKNIEHYVDIESSINDGIIQKKDIQKISESDKQLLICLNNFDNLSLPMKLSLLIEHLKDEKETLAELQGDQLLEKDDYGRTPKDRYRLLKNIAKDLHYYLFLRLRENKLNAKVEE